MPRAGDQTVSDDSKIHITRTPKKACVACGAPIRARSRFCHVCGRPQPDYKAVSVKSLTDITRTPKKACVACGASIRARSRFCHVCGRPQPGQQAAVAMHSQSAARAELLKTKALRPQTKVITSGVGMGTGAVISFIGCLLPWIGNSLGAHLNGFSLYNSGWIVSLHAFFLVVSGIAVSLGFYRREAATAGFYSSMVIAGISGVFLYSINRLLSETISDSFPVKNKDILSVKYGIWFLLVGSIIGLLFSFQGIISRKGID